MRGGTGQQAWRGRLHVPLVAAGLAVLALTAACGTVAAPGDLRAQLADHHGGPPWTDRAGALVAARNALAQVVLPAGSRQLPQRPLPTGLRRPASSMAATEYLDRYRVYRLGLPIGAAVRFLRTHLPAGMTLQSTGNSGIRGRITERDQSFGPRREPFGIDTLSLVETLVAGPHGHALMRADAEVIWFPRRPASEHLTAADYRSIRVVAEIYGTKPRTIARTYTSPGAIGRIIRLLNSLPAAPGEAFSCPAELVTVRVAFTPTAGHPAAVTSSSGCGGDGLVLGGKRQPTLNDFGSLVTLVERLLHLHKNDLLPTAHH
jgi:hypothetical protein